MNKVRIRNVINLSWKLPLAGGEANLAEKLAVSSPIGKGCRKKKGEMHSGNSFGKWLLKF